MNSNTNCTIWKRVILPTALYGCDIWGFLTSIELNMLESTQRYFSRFIVGLDKRSPTDSCVSNLGLWSIEGYIDKLKLLLFGRLCRANVSTTHKQLFTFRVCQTILGETGSLSITYDFVQNMTCYLFLKI